MGSHWQNGSVQEIEKVVPAETETSETVTFNRDIAPIIFEKCSGCHRPGQVGPFSLLTYNDVTKRARTIEAVIDSGYMPPWKPVDHGVEFANDRSLSRSEIQKIKTWVAAKHPRGNGQPPTPPKFKDGWTLGEPDLVIRMNGAFEVPASGPDIYRSFVFPCQFENDKWIKAIEYRPSASTAVHHAIFYFDQNGNARKMDGADGKPGIAGMGFLGSAPSTEGGLVGQGVRSLSNLIRRSADQRPSFEVANQLSRGLGAYVPGTTPAKLPGDLAMKLPKQSDIVMQTHFHPSGKVEVEKGEIALYFADKQPSQMIVPIQVPAMFSIGLGLKVPPGVSDYRIRESFQTPIDIKLISVAAHAHYICKHVSMTATYPDKSNKVLLEIDDWDLDWQDRYFFKEHIVLPAGTVLTAELVYDNSPDNPENPYHPPREIRWGRESNDEMGSVTVHSIAVDESQRNQIEMALQDYFRKSITQGDIVDLLMQLDTNRDGGLQKTEVPPRMAQRFNLLDRNGNEKLDRDELEILRRLLPGKKRAN